MNFDPIEEYEDVNEAAVTDWTSETTTRERIKAVIMRTTEPTSASEVADKARASQSSVLNSTTSLIADSSRRSMVDRAHCTSVTTRCTFTSRC
jgi:predicted Zn-ribbon and HTH transcriptional regulator